MTDRGEFIAFIEVAFDADDYDDAEKLLLEYAKLLLKREEVTNFDGDLG